MVYNKVWDRLWDRMNFIQNRRKNKSNKGVVNKYNKKL